MDTLPVRRFVPRISQNMNFTQLPICPFRSNLKPLPVVVRAVFGGNHHDGFNITEGKISPFAVCGLSRTPPAVDRGAAEISVKGFIILIDIIPWVFIAGSKC
eukprot:2514424-Rhodomonas_salina.3